MVGQGKALAGLQAGRTAVAAFERHVALLPLTGVGGDRGAAPGGFLVVVKDLPEHAAQQVDQERRQGKGTAETVHRRGTSGLPPICQKNTVRPPFVPSPLVGIRDFP